MHQALMEAAVAAWDVKILYNVAQAVAHARLVLNRLKLRIKRNTLLLHAHRPP